MKDMDLDREMTQLDACDVDSWRREHIRQRAHRCLEAKAPSGMAVAYRRVIEPALLTAFCGAHLLWAFLAVARVLLP